MPHSAALARGSIPRHLVAQTLPMVLGIACLMGVGLLDAFLIGRLGPEPLAAVGFIFPVNVTLSSLGVGVMVAINSVVSRALGANERDRAAARGVQGIALAAVVGLAIAGALLVGRDALFGALQADAALLPLIGEYVVPYAIGFPAILVAMGANGVLRGQGEAVKSSSILVVLALVNGVLDPLLIFGIGPFPTLGIAGAGWATALANLAAAVLGLALCSTCALPLHPRKALGHGVGAGLAELGRVGLPAAVANAINPVGIAVLTALLARHGQDAVAAFGAAGRLQSAAVVPLLALSSSIGPITGQNWGAGEPGRARRALRLASGFCVAYGLAVALALCLLREPIAGAFTGDAAVADQIARYLLVASWGFAGFGLLVVANGALNAVDRSGLAFRLSAARVALVMLPLGWAGTTLAGPGAVYGAELAANVAGGALAFWLARRALGGGTGASDARAAAETRPATKPAEAAAT